MSTESEQLSVLGRSAWLAMREGLVKLLDGNEFISEKEGAF